MLAGGEGEHCRPRAGIHVTSNRALVGLVGGEGFRVKGLGVVQDRPTSKPYTLLSTCAAGGEGKQGHQAEVHQPGYAARQAHCPSSLPAGLFGACSACSCFCFHRAWRFWRAGVQSCLSGALAFEVMFGHDLHTDPQWFHPARLVAACVSCLWHALMPCRCHAFVKISLRTAVAC